MHRYIDCHLKGCLACLLRYKWAGSRPGTKLAPLYRLAVAFDHGRTGAFTRRVLAPNIFFDGYEPRYKLLLRAVKELQQAFLYFPMSAKAREHASRTIISPMHVHAILTVLSIHAGMNSKGGTTVAVLLCKGLGMPPSSASLLPTGATGAVSPKLPFCGSSIGPSGASGGKTRGTLGSAHQLLSIRDGSIDLGA